MRLRKLLSLAVLVGLMSVMTAQIAVAAPPETVAACQQGANSAHASAWELIDVDQLTIYYGGNADAAKATFDFCDHNDDGLVCTMKQTLPNDASGSMIWYLSEDNHYAPPQAQ